MLVPARLLHEKSGVVVFCKNSALLAPANTSGEAIAGTRFLTGRGPSRHDASRTMLLNHAPSTRPWQRDLALLAMTFVIVKGARESVGC
jgi:hypothetical protein